VSRRDGAARLLGWGVRLLPARRQEWGRAMLAELAAIESGPARWRFALSCTRAALSLPATVFKVAQRLLVAGVVVGAVVLAAGIPAPVMRREAIAMVAILAVVAWLARRAFFGPRAAGRTTWLVSAGAFAIVATEVLFFIRDARRSPGSATAEIAVWTVMLTVYALAVARVTARRSTVATPTLATGAGIGVAGAAAWLAAVAVHPSVPTSSGPAVLAIAGAAVCAELVGDRIAGLTAAAGTALLIAVLIDGPLRLFAPWVANSAPPVYPPETVDRLVDSIGVWLLGCLLATALTLAIRVRAPARA
jgi:hypothetical protein